MAGTGLSRRIRPNGLVSGRKRIEKSHRLNPNGVGGSTADTVSICRTDAVHASLEEAGDPGLRRRFRPDEAELHHPPGQGFRAVQPGLDGGRTSVVRDGYAQESQRRRRRAHLHRRRHVPDGAFENPCRNHVVDVIHPDLSTSCGILETKRIGDMA